MTPVEQLLKAVSEEAHRTRRRVFVVGGLLRDQRLGKPTQDIDFVVDGAVEPFARRVGTRLRGHAFVLDAERQVFRVVVQHTASQYHLDFARRQGKTIQQDLARRDFTINALAAPLNAEVSLNRLEQTTIDPYQGIADLRRRVIRHIAPSIFHDDPVRHLRAVRLAAQLEARLHPTTLRLMRRDASALRKAAPERIREELFKLLAVHRSAPWLRLLARSGALSVLFPELEACRNVARRYYPRGGVLGHSLDAVALLETLCFENLPPAIAPKSPARQDTWYRDFQAYLDQPIGGAFPRRVLLKLAELLHDIAKPVTAKRIAGRLRFFGHEEVGAAMARKLLQRLRCSREETRVIAVWVQHHLRLGNLAHAAQVSDRAIFRYFRDLEPEGVGMVLVSLADHWTYCATRQRGRGKDPVERIAARLLQYYYFRPEVVRPIRLLNGRQLMRALHLKEGPLIGQLLRAIQDAQAAGQVTTRDEALNHARATLAKPLQ